VLLDLHFPRAYTTPAGIYTGTDPTDAPEMMEVIVDVINDFRGTLTEGRNRPPPRRRLKAGLLMALESCSSRAEQSGSPHAGLWPSR